MGRKNRAPRVSRQAESVSTTRKTDLNFNWSRNWILGGILALTFIAFFNTLFNGFAYDDTTQILKNELIRDWSNLPEALTKEVWFWRAAQEKDPNQQAGPTTPYYRPVFIVYLMIGWHLFGDEPFGWHLFNILMHMIAVYFAFLILEKITGDVRLSSIATLLFAVHPLRSESVAWISGSTDLFLALFILPSFYNYMLYREGGRRKHLLIALGLFLLAAFSKEPAVALPIFIAAYELYLINQEKPVEQRRISAVLYSGFFFAVMLAYFFMRFKALGFIFNDAKYRAYPPEWVFLTIPLAIIKYIGLLFFPLNLSVFHQTIMVKSPLSYRFYVPFLLLAVLGLGLWRLRHSTNARFAMLWFLINLLPVLNLSAFDENFLVQERYVYLPSIGFSLLIAMAIVKVPIEEWISIGNRRTAQAVVIGVIAILFTGKTLAQNSTWKDDMTLWSHGAAVADDQPMASFILGHQYIKLQQPQNVIEPLEHYLTLNPTNQIVMSNLAATRLQVYELTGDRSQIDRAIALCEQGLRISDQAAALWDTLGHAYTYDTDLKNFTRARRYFNQALQIEPELTIALFHMGATYIKEGNAVEGLGYLEAAQQKMPDFPDTYKFLGYAYSGRGEVQKAIDALTYYVQSLPNAPDTPKIKQELERLRARLQTVQAVESGSQNPVTPTATGQLPATGNKPTPK
jgi:tetratricopeptide (TPR) repeat protein